MNKYLVTILFTTFINFVKGQSEKPNYKSVLDSFEIKYNADNFEGIFSRFSPEMQIALPLDKTKDFLAGLKIQAGKITKREFVKYEQPYASYKTSFEFITLSQYSKSNLL